MLSTCSVRVSVACMITSVGCVKTTVGCVKTTVGCLITTVECLIILWTLTCICLFHTYKGVSGMCGTVTTEGCVIATAGFLITCVGCLITTVDFNLHISTIRLARCCLPEVCRVQVSVACTRYHGREHYKRASTCAAINNLTL